MEVLACVEVQACRRAGVPAAELASGSRVAARRVRVKRWCVPTHPTWARGHCFGVHVARILSG